MKIKFLDLNKINEQANKNIINIIQETLNSCKYIEAYNETEFENNFKNYCGSQFCNAEKWAKKNALYRSLGG